MPTSVDTARTARAGDTERRTNATQPPRLALVGCGAVAKANLLPVLAGHDGITLPTDVDGVILATPPAHHAPATITLVERGLHVFVEKPMATTLADAEAMVAAAERAGVTLGVWDPATRSC